MKKNAYFNCKSSWLHHITHHVLA
uniref:Uncharacterized protein n=1 Tax=Arundo donax TaxID=35708 RepID=A0A0A8YU56_ARUDO